MNNLIKTLFLRPAVAAFIFAMIVFLPVKAEAKTALEFDSEGNLTVTTRDKAATSYIRYRTLGWTIKQKDKAIGAAGNATCRVKLEQASSYKDPKDSSYVITVFKISKEVIFEKISSASESWANTLYRNGGTVYFDGIMTVVKGGAAEGYLNSDGTYGGKVYFTYAGIAAAQAWSDTAGLKSHFDIPVKFNANDKMLTAKGSINYMEAVSRDTFSGAKSLSRLGLNENLKLAGKKYTFTAEDLTGRGYEYVGAKVAVKKWGEDASEITYYGSTEKSVVIDNRNYKYRRVAINFYYYRQGSGEEYYTTADSLDEMCAKARVKIYSDEYDVEKAIPGSENVKVSAYAQKYGLNAVYIRHSGWISVPVNAVYYDEEGNRCSFTVYVEREYSYFTLEDAVLEDLETVTVYNDAISGGRVVFSPTAYKLVYKKYGSLSGHVYYPARSVYVSSPDEAQAAAERAVPYVSVRNDMLKVDGGLTYLVDGYYSRSAPYPVADGNYMANLGIKTTYIPKETMNGLYTSSAKAVYRVSGLTEKGADESRSLEVNSVVVHTPVVCCAECSDDTAHNQQETPTKYNSIILGRTVTVKINTYGQHLDEAAGYKGYGRRSYEKYTLKRWVGFPFDVVMAGEVKKAGTWITLPREGATFTVPIYVEEGDYEISFRTYAFNVESVYGGEDFVQQDANTMTGCYGATDSIKVSVIGRLYGFELVDIIDYPRWQSVFRLGDGILWCDLHIRNE